MTDQPDERYAIYSYDNTEERMLKAKFDQVMALINAHFHTEDVPSDDGRTTHRMLVCNDCGKAVTWVSRHLAERHDMDIEVWRLPKWADRQELW
jgi:predicted transcriptional regulator